MGWERVEGRFCVDGSTFSFICFRCFQVPFPLRLWFICLGVWTFFQIPSFLFFDSLNQSVAQQPTSA
ncbi:hypothetical protein PILCRDRAFT_753443 [Piloderma croceum F 1598]|uniref:Uncharacterized protein n=1 Tax=Piloderma croceum (strain F 1598) TaxID=765440 RepID=A0A0C3EFL8_PILCF|nr:hypothetical protein PILCRDRAFT_753443 [Piloderma croceum F 1598]